MLRCHRMHVRKQLRSISEKERELLTGLRAELEEERTSTVHNNQHSRGRDDEGNLHAPPALCPARFARVRTAEPVPEAVVADRPASVALVVYGPARVTVQDLEPRRGPVRGRGGRPGEAQLPHAPEAGQLLRPHVPRAALGLLRGSAESYDLPNHEPVCGRQRLERCDERGSAGRGGYHLS